jgi:hypothetical protein
MIGVFVAAVTGGRTFGTLALDRWGRVPVLLASAVLAGVGACVTVLGGFLPLAGSGWCCGGPAPRSASRWV